MTSENDSSRRNPEKGNLNLFTALLLFGLAAAFLAVFLVNAQSVTLTKSQLLELIRTGEVVLSRDLKTQRMTVAHSMREVVVGHHQVTGKLRLEKRPWSPNQAAASTLDATAVDNANDIAEAPAPTTDAQVSSSTLAADGPSGDNATAEGIAEATPTTDEANDVAAKGEPSTQPAANLAKKKAPEFRAFQVDKLNDATSTEEINLALKANGILYAEEGGPSFLQAYGPMLLITLIFLTLVYFMLRRLGGSGSPMTFGRSKGRLYAQEDLGLSFDNVAGIDEAVEEVKEVVDFLQSPEKYQRLGGRIPRGVLLVGPPGTGKTLLAKAIAGEAGVPFFSLSGSDFVEMFVGVGAARVRDMFQQAEAKAPCIIFIDELDALGKSRGSGMVGGHDEREQTLNALLVEMDGFEPNLGIIVVAATNRPEMLDQALMRPGRFDRQVLVDRPDVRGREDILNVHVKNVKLDPSVRLDQVAAITPGFAGADLANLVNEAALLAARQNKNAVGMAEFNNGVERVTAGLEKKQRVMNEDEKVRVAYHEAGHALVAYSLPNTDPVHKVSIIPRGFAALGYTMQRPESDRYLMTQGELESRIQVLLAGTVAEEMIFEDISTGASNDLERCTDTARSMVMDYGMSRMGRIAFRDNGGPAFLATPQEERTHGVSEETAREIDREVKRILDEALENVRQILHTRRDALVALSRRLMEVESIGAEELQEIVDENSPGPIVVPGTATRHAMKHPQDEISSNRDKRAADG